MNQEILSVLHLLDARIAVWDGDPNPDTSLRKEYSMPELDNLFKDCIKNKPPQIIEDVRTAITDGLKNIFDYKGNRKDLIEEPPLVPNGKPYLRIKHNKSILPVEETGTKLQIPGIIISVDYNVMRTEGILVEALLGQSNALDDYSSRLQNASVKLKELENEQSRIETAKKELAISIVNSNDNEKAELFTKIYPCCKPTIFSLWPPKESDDKIGDITNGQKEE